MGYPLLDEFSRAHDFQPQFLRRCQRVFRDELNPYIDKLERENAELRAHVEALEADLARVSKKAAKRESAAV